MTTRPRSIDRRPVGGDLGEPGLAHRPARSTMGRSLDQTAVDTGDGAMGTTVADLDGIAELVGLAARATAELWRDSGPDGELAVRLVEVSHALHRAALALADVGLIGGTGWDARAAWSVGPPARDPDQGGGDHSVVAVRGSGR